ncbi:MAG: hemerythrin domain-containing protein [Alphaproteobacteria bacterium]
MPPPVAPYLIARVDPALLRQPLAFLTADMFRVRMACFALDLVAADPLAEPPQLAHALADYFRRDWPLHLDDIEQRLFPAIRAALLVGDHVDQAMDQLAAEHVRDRAQIGPLLADIDRLGARDSQLDEERLAIRAAHFGEAQRRHVAWVQNVILPTAEHRLAGAQARKLAAALAEVRGHRLEYLDEG